MLQSIQGIYRQGTIELLEPAPANADGKVIITFLAAGSVDLAERGIDPQHADSLRRRFSAIAEDWDRPEMDAYDAI